MFNSSTDSQLGIASVQQVSSFPNFSVTTLSRMCSLLLIYEGEMSVNISAQNNSFGDENLLMFRLAQASSPHMTTLK
jgi:hypothetical protein